MPSFVAEDFKIEHYLREIKGPLPQTIFAENKAVSRDPQGGRRFVGAFGQLRRR
jgi:hypothetical protein